MFAPRDRVVFIGGGAGGALSLPWRPGERWGEAVKIRLWCRREFLPGHGAAAKRLLLRKLAQANISWSKGVVSADGGAAPRFNAGVGRGCRNRRSAFCGRRPTAVRPSVLGYRRHRPGLGAGQRLGNGRQGLSFGWRRRLGPSPTNRFYAAGDVIHFTNRALAKSGVYAVRAGTVLADNLRRAAQGHPLRTFKPQRRLLSLIGTGDESAVASWGSLAVQGRCGMALEKLDRPALHGEVPTVAVDGSPALAAALAPRSKYGTVGAHALRRLRRQAGGRRELQRALSRLPLQDGPRPDPRHRRRRRRAGRRSGPLGAQHRRLPRLGGRPLPSSAASPPTIA